MAGIGGYLGPRARRQVDKLAEQGVPPDDPAWQQGEEFIAQEERKGKILMAVGIPLAVGGAVLTGVGIRSLIRSKQKARVGAAAFLWEEGAIASFHITF